MGWTAIEEREDRVRWERADGNAILTARATATGEWAVTLDRLEQAPAGPAYDHEVATDREAALAIAERWRDDYDTH